MKIYLDNCMFNRPFDEQTHIRIRLETEAKLAIQEEIRRGTYQLIWPYILDYENSKNPFQERKEQIIKWTRYILLVLFLRKLTTFSLPMTKSSKRQTP